MASTDDEEVLSVYRERPSFPKPPETTGETHRGHRKAGPAAVLGTPGAVSVLPRSGCGEPGADVSGASYVPAPRTTSRRETGKFVAPHEPLLSALRAAAAPAMRTRSWVGNASSRDEPAELRRAGAGSDTGTGTGTGTGSLPQKSAIVIGCGMSGLAAAQELTAHGFVVTVLEGRDRIGGRVWTDFSLGGAAVDMGACWLHGAEGNPLTPLFTKLKIKTFCTSGSDSVLYDHDLNSYALYDNDGSRVPVEVVDEAMADFETILDRAWEISDSLLPAEDMDMRTALDTAVADCKDVNLTGQRGRVLNWFLARVEGWFCAPLEDISLRHYNTEVLLPGGHHVVVHGYSQVLDALAKGLDIRLNKDVVAVQRTGTGVVVRTADGATYAADACVNTMPIGVLKTHRVEFQPPLPSWKQDAIEDIGFGLENKVVLRFPASFWPDVDFLGDTRKAAKDCSYFLNLGRSTGVPVLVYMPAGTLAHKFEELDDAAIVEEAVTVLRRMFPGIAVPSPTSHAITRWGKDRFAHGAYSYDRPCTDGHVDYANMGRNCGRLYWAGEHCSRLYPGTVHGAYSEGVRAALEVSADSVGATRPQAGDFTGVPRPQGGSVREDSVRRLATLAEQSISAPPAASKL